MPWTPGRFGWQDSQRSYDGSSHESQPSTLRGADFSISTGAPPDCWSAFWSVLFLLYAVESADELLAWSTGPELDFGLRIDRETALLVGLVCVDVAEDSALWRLSAAWPAACTPPLPPRPPLDCCSAFWSVLFLLAAIDSADELLACLTAPELACGLRIATLIALLVGLLCVEVAEEAALCALDAAWPTPCSPPPPPPPPPAACAAFCAVALRFPAAE